MGIKITSVSEALEDNGLKFLVHSLAGAGKTVFCATARASTLIVSAESGLLSIAEAPSYVQTTVVKTIDELEQAYIYLRDHQGEFKWCCIDSISEIAEVLLADEKKNSKDPRAAYGNLSDRMLHILRQFRDLSHMNVVMTSKQQRQVDEDTNVTRFVPLMPGKSLTNNIAYLFDEVFALRVEKDEEGVDYRILQTGRDRNYEAKDRSGKLDMFETPELWRIAEKIRKPYDDEDTHSDLDYEPDQEVDGEIENASGKAENVSEEDTYWYHAESESAVLIPAGEPLGETPEQCVELTKEAYHKWQGAGDNGTDKEKDDVKKEENKTDLPPIIATKKVLYLKHSSGKVIKLAKGEECNDDGNIEIIKMAEYVKLKKIMEAKEATDECDEEEEGKKGETLGAENTSF